MRRGKHDMKNIIKAGLLTVATAAAIGVPAIAASASTGPVAGGNGQIATLTGNSATSYTDPVFGGVQCNETSHPKFDTVECQFTAGQVLTPSGIQTVGWNSDFAGSGHNTGVLTYQIKTDGSGYTGKATYPNG